MYYTTIQTKLCQITLVGDERGLKHLSLDVNEDEHMEKIDTNLIYNPEFFIDWEEQIHEYFKGDRKVFEIPLFIEGTDFQKKVWEALLEIPYGETNSYKDIGIKIGNKKAARAVGNANNKNPLPLIIPCHRVIGSNGKMVGYAKGIDIKKTLLRHEKNLI